MLRTAIHPAFGEYRQIPHPIIYDRKDTAVRSHAPFVGEHTMQVLREAGLSAAEITQLLSDGAAVQGRQKPADL
ncbi:hypothetical protein [Nocardia cerradoensis]|uniref:hypothetical protein n=1 Tax=Nocardia cerradoensis TaxID=85688 RepID=UPI001CB972FA|nr:hypothetical protein [Nocardia cerradoensis]